MSKLVQKLKSGNYDSADILEACIFLSENQALRDELEAVKAGMNKVKADAILSVIATPEDCETPTGDIAWSSESIQLIAEFHLEKGQ